MRYRGFKIPLSYDEIMSSVETNEEYESFGMVIIPVESDFCRLGVPVARNIISYYPYELLLNMIYEFIDAYYQPEDYIW